MAIVEQAAFADFGDDLGRTQLLTFASPSSREVWVAGGASDLRTFGHCTRVATWNLAANSRHRGVEAFEFMLDAIRPNIAMLQEAPPQLADRPSVIAFQAQPHEVWGSAVYVAPPLRAEQLHPPLAPTWPACRIAAAEVQLGGAVLSVASVHPAWYEHSAIGNADPDAAHWHLDGADNVWHCDLAYGVAKSSLTAPLVVGGDWNTARKFQKSPYADARVSEAFFERLSREGWTDCTWQRWEGEERPTHRGYQLDHLFADNETAQRFVECSIIDTEQTRALSDHLPLVAEVALHRSDPAH